MPTRLLHVSDLHFGSREEASIGRGTAELVARTEPELIVASGDLSHRGRADQHERASAFLGSLGPPVLAVPGNHDVPYTFPARFTRPWAEFERRWSTVEPVYSSPALHVVGINSVRPWRHQSGGVDEAQLERAVERLASAPPGALRVAVLHHHAVAAPWRSRKRPVSGRARLLARLAEAGADLVLGGHVHQAAVSERREFAVVPGGSRAMVVSIAPGLGQPRPRRLGEARGAQFYTADDESLVVETLVWAGEGWSTTGLRRFARDVA